MDKKSPSKVKKVGKSSYEELPEIPDYERPELEKFERDEYEYSKDDENTRELSIKSDDEDQEMTSEPSTKNINLSKAKLESKSNDNKIKSQNNDHLRSEDRQAVDKNDSPKKITEKTKKSPGEIKTSTREKSSEFEVDEAKDDLNVQEMTPRSKPTDEQQDSNKKDNNTLRKSEIEVPKKIKKKVGKSAYDDLPEIHDYERPELEKFDKDDHEFSWEGIQTTDFQDDIEISDSPKNSKNLKSRQYQEPSSRIETSISKSDEEISIEKVQLSKKSLKSDKLIEDKKKPDLKVLQKNDDEQKLSKSSKPSLTPKPNTEELKKIPDGNKNELDDYVESDFDPSKKSKARKSGIPDDDILPEISDFEKTELEQFNKDDHDFSGPDDDDIKPLKYGKGNRMADSDKSTVNSKALKRESVKDDNKDAKKESNQKEKSSEDQAIPDSEQTELKKNEKSYVDSKKKPKTKKSEKSNNDDLPEIPNYEPTKLEKFDRGAHEIPRDEMFGYKKTSRKMSDEDDVEMLPKTLEKSIIESSKPSLSQEESKKTSKPETKLDKMQPKNTKTADAKKIVEDDKSNTSSQAEKDKQDTKISQPCLKGKNKDDESPKSQDSSEIKKDSSDLETSKKQKSKKSLNQAQYDLPEISDYESPVLEKFDKGDHDFGNQGVEIKDSNKRSSKLPTKDNLKTSLTKDESIVQTNLNLNNTDKSTENQKENDKATPRKRLEPEKSITEEKPKDLKSSQKSKIDLNLAFDETKEGDVKTRSSSNLPKIDDDDRPDLEKYKESGFNPTKSLNDKKLEKLKPEEKNKLTEYEKQELEKYERLDTLPNKKTKEDDKSWSGKLKPKEDDAFKDGDLKTLNNDSIGKNQDAFRKSSLDKLNLLSKKDEENPIRKSSLDKPSVRNDSSPVGNKNDDTERKLSFENKSPEELTANERYLMRRLNKKLAPSNSSSDVTVKPPRQDPLKTSSEAEPTSVDIRTRASRSTPTVEEATSKNIQVKESREVPIEIMITEPESPTDKKGPNINEKTVTKPGPRNPRYDPLAFVPEDEELPSQPKTFPPTPTSPFSPNKATYNPFQYDLDEDEETPDEKVNTQNKLCNLKFK